MKESIPKPPEVPPPLPDIEQMADWIIKHEDTPSKTSGAKEVSSAKLKDQLFESEPEESSLRVERPETYFERRHEVKEKPSVTPDPNTKPMIPIAHVLQTRSLLPEKPTLIKQVTSANRLRQLAQPASTQYASAVLQGFGAAIILIILTVIYLVIKALS